MKNSPTLHDLNSVDAQQMLDLFSTILNYIPYLIGLLDRDGNWIHANQPLLKFLNMDDLPYKGKSFSQILKFPRINHDDISYLKNRFELKDLGRTVDLLHGVWDIQFRDVQNGWLLLGETVKTQQELSLKKNQALESLVLNSPLAIISFDHDGIIQTWNPAAELTFGWSSSEVIGLHLPFISDAEQEEFRDLLGIMLQGKALTDVEFRCVKKNGEPIDISLSITLLYDKMGDISGGMAVITDITERMEAQQVIKHMAYHDRLTGLPNRTLFYDRVNQALKQAKRNQSVFAIFFLDLDGFKVVNDSFGHANGDLLLQLVAVRLQACIREVDTLARQGGDEFTALLMDISSEDVVEVADRMITSLSQPFSINGQPITISASIGISLYPAHGQDIETLLKEADKAMYRAKKQGKDHYQLAENSH